MQVHGRIVVLIFIEAVVGCFCYAKLRRRRRACSGLCLRVMSDIRVAPAVNTNANGQQQRRHADWRSVTDDPARTRRPLARLSVLFSKPIEVTSFAILPSSHTLALLCSYENCLPHGGAQ